MRVFSVLGYSGSGKTTTIECIVKELRRRNYSVGTIKDIHYGQFTMDKEGTNTDRHKKAGSDPVTARGFHETNILYAGRLPIEDIIRHYSQDFVIMEGVEDYIAPRIVCARTAKEIEAQIGPEVFAISGVVANEKQSVFGKVPVFNALTDAQRLVDYIEAKVF